MRKLTIFTLGCKVNQYESEALSQLFSKNGYEIVNEGDDADVYIINSCSVTNMSDRKSRKIIRSATKRPNQPIVVVTGCYSQAKPQEVAEIEGVTIVTGTNNKKEIYSLVENAIAKKEKMISIFPENIHTNFNFEPVTDYLEKTRAIIKIQDGCDSFCSYCIIPYLRGRLRSRALDEIVKEVQTVAENGYKEIVLAGIHVCKYGIDQQNLSLPKLLVELSEIRSIQRIRLSSIEPSAFTDEFFHMFSNMKKLCPHFHISLQSGSNSVIKRMNRNYTAQHFSNIIDKLKSIHPNTMITTDIIVGFPGESEEEFGETLELCKKVRFLKAHVFKYSKRDGTIAAEMENQVDDKIKDLRSKDLIKLCETIEEDVMNAYIGKILPVLFEEEKNGYFFGYSDNYIPTMVKSSETLVGKISNIMIDNFDKLVAFGHVI